MGMDHQALLKDLQRNRRAVVRGCPDSYLALILSRILGSYPPPLVVVAPDEDRARAMAQDLDFFVGGAGPEEDSAEGTMRLPAVMHLPAVETSPYAEISPDRVAVMQRLGVLFRLSQGYAGPVLVTSAAALRRRVIPARALACLTDLVAVEEEVDRDSLIARLVSCGFNRVQVVEDPGTFAVRGGILDLFPPLFSFPVRLEFFGDLVESIRLFDPGSQRTLRSVEEVPFHPVRETIPTEGSELKARVLQAADRAKHPSSRTRLLLEELESGREFFGVEAMAPAYHKALVPLTDYLPDEALWVVLDPEGVEVALEQEDARSEAGHSSRLAEGRLTFEPGDFFVAAAELAELLRGKRRIEAGLVAHDLGAEAAVGDGAGHSVRVRDNADIAAELQQARSERGEAILRALVARLRQWQEEGRRVMIAAGSQPQADRLGALLKGYGVAWVEERAAGAAEAPVTLSSRRLGRGFRDPGGEVVLTEEEIFGPKARRRPARRFSGAGVGDLGQLEEGDPTVHAEHGVGLYRGLKKLEIGGVPADFLLLEYAGADRLYLPVYRMDLVQKYVGADGAAPRLDKLGGITWARKKGKVKADVRKMAEELLQIYAQRAALEGHAYPAPDAVYDEFEATFPFTETTDQGRAVEEVLDDLTAGRPMDRLVCGDVGFGKTEVALRAAFLVAMSGRQVAVLAPTTVLVEQHYRTFADRFSPYPVRVEAVSRFRSRKELAKVFEDLTAGKVDVAIGTHRLLSSDVRFRDLGLLVIDEEHRFGVAHKERLKRMRTQVDVLTMTATPIPRTLHMGMTGMRAISIISTPPVDRLAIRTFVCRYDEALVGEAIRKELDRGGQVFFVHNRVRDIEKWAERITDLVPGAKVVVGHGQMDASRLERVMVDFVAGRYDVLVCTAIIESGLDIPRANTMFINKADHFGLAQLYQLRGRIGRSRHRAFCYLLVPGFEAMTPDARRRLTALERFTELGSGFSVASHDLEIRGAGELLGAKQSGQIAAVGFDAYARILEEAVAELKGEPISAESDPEINTPGLSAYIPDDYVEDTGQRLTLYKRLSHAAQDAEAVGDILAEVRDRYGSQPLEVDGLGELMVIKGLASRLGVTVVDLAGGRLSLTLSEATPLTPEQVIGLVERRGSSFRLTPEMRLICTLEVAAVERESLAALSAAKKVLHELIAHVN
jgi:transcription-repair coupling factor (superfamily II helicase)